MDQLWPVMLEEKDDINLGSGLSSSRNEHGRTDTNIC